MSTTTAPARRAITQAAGLASALGVAVLGLSVWPVYASDEPGADTDPFAAAGAEIFERVQTARGLEALSVVPVRPVTPEQASAEQLADFEAEDLAEIAGDELLLVRLGLLPPDTDLLALLASLAQSDVAGYYRPDQGDIAVVDRDGQLDVIDEWILTHEYVHALQDQHYGLEATIEAYPQGDSQTAVLALAEGDATLAMTTLAIQTALAGDGAIDEDLLGTSQLGSLPLLIERELLFPYLDGMDFVRRIWGRGGWAAVDGMWLDPPRSTEQIMHPRRYPDELPVDVPDLDVASLLGADWSVGYDTTMGELRLSVLLAAHEGYELPEVPFASPRLPNAEAADGWAGDRAFSIDGPDGAWAVVWQTTWDTVDDATEFAAVARESMAAIADHHTVAAETDITAAAAEDQGVLLVVADSARTLSTLEAALGVD